MIARLLLFALLLPALASATSGEPGPPPASCFGRDVRYYEYKKSSPNSYDGLFAPGNSHSISNPSFPANSIYIARFKTDDAGYMMLSMQAIHDGVTALLFISPQPCDYTWAYDHSVDPDLAVRGMNGSFVVNYWINANFKDIPVLADNQVAPYFAGKAALYSKKRYLKPNTYYYFHVLAAAIDTNAVKTNEQLSAVPTSCRGSCYYLHLDYFSIFRVEGENTIPGLPQAERPANPASGCDAAAGEVFGGGDVNNSMMADYPFPITPATATGDLGRAVRFVAKSGAFQAAAGSTLSTIDQSGQPSAIEVAVSACPHSFTPLDGNPHCRGGTAAIGTDISVSFGPAKRYYDCPVTPGATYYLNFRDANSPKGAVSAQFVNKIY